jgi:hypothetical protein
VNADRPRSHVTALAHALVRRCLVAVPICLVSFLACHPCEDGLLELARFEGVAHSREQVIGHCVGSTTWFAVSDRRQMSVDDVLRECGAEPCSFLIGRPSGRAAVEACLLPSAVNIPTLCRDPLRSELVGGRLSVTPLALSEQVRREVFESEIRALFPPTGPLQ